MLQQDLNSRFILTYKVENNMWDSQISNNSFIIEMVQVIQWKAYYKLHL